MEDEDDEDEIGHMRLPWIRHYESSLVNIRHSYIWHPVMLSAPSTPTGKHPETSNDGHNQIAEINAA